MVSSGSAAIVTAYCAAPDIGAQRRISASAGWVEGVMNDAPSDGVVTFVTGAHLSAMVRVFVQGDVLLAAVTLRTRQ